MKEVTRNFLIGLFVLGSLSGLGVLMVWFGERPDWLGGGDWELRITGVRELSGIGQGSPIRLNGVEIGRVRVLEFADPDRPDRGVEVVGRIKKTYNVAQGATARIYGAALGVGTGHVDIVLAPNASTVPLPKTKARIPGEMRSMIGEFITKDMISDIKKTIRHIGDVAKEWAPVGTNIARQLESRSVADLARPGAAERGLRPNVTTVIERIDNLVAELNAVLGDENVQKDVKAAVRDLRDVTADLKQMVELWKSQSQSLADNVNAGIDRTEANFDRSFANLNKVLERLDESAKGLSTLLYDVNRGEGSAGLLLHDERLYESAVLALRRFSDAMASFQRILGKVERDGYITVGKAPAPRILRKEFPISGGKQAHTDGLTSPAP